LFTGLKFKVYTNPTRKRGIESILRMGRFKERGGEWEKQKERV